MTDAPLILVVDDIEDNRYALTRRLKREGYERVIEATNGREALDKLESENVDLVLLDIMMPEIDGFEVLRRMRADTRLRHVGVIIISASEDLESIVKAVELGAEDYIPKPFNPTLLKARIDASLTRKRLRDHEAAYTRRLEEERRRADRFLRAILPDEAVRELKATDERASRGASTTSPSCSATSSASRPIARTIRRNRWSRRWAGWSAASRRPPSSTGWRSSRPWATPSLPRPACCARSTARCWPASGPATTWWRRRPSSIRRGRCASASTRARWWRHHGQPALPVRPVGRRGQHRRPHRLGLPARRGDGVGDTWLQIRDECRGRSRGPITLKGKGDVELIEVVSA